MCWFCILQLCQIHLLALIGLCVCVCACVHMHVYVDFLGFFTYNIFRIKYFLSGSSIILQGVFLSLTPLTFFLVSTSGPFGAFFLSSHVTSLINLFQWLHWPSSNLGAMLELLNRVLPFKILPCSRDHELFQFFEHTLLASGPLHYFLCLNDCHLPSPYLWLTPCVRKPFWPAVTVRRS